MLKVKKNVYKAFGLIISSDINLPELITLEDIRCKIDVEIEVQDLKGVWDNFTNEGKKTFYQNDLFMFNFSEIAIFMVNNGNKIIVSPYDGADIEQIRLYILGTCMGALLMQRRILPLHGSAVDINGKVYAFIGDSGVGKSTLAAAFLNRGYNLVSDDIVAVYLSDSKGQPSIIPSYPHQKLWDESIKKLGYDSQNYKPIFLRERKFSIPVLRNFKDEVVPLAGVFQLNKNGNSDSIEIVETKGLERLDILTKNTYRNFIIPRMGLMDWHFKFLTKIVNQIEVYQLYRSNNGFTVDKIVSKILNQIERVEEQKWLVK